MKKVDIRILRARVKAVELRPYFATALWSLSFFEVKGLTAMVGGPLGTDEFWRTYYDPDRLDETKPDHLAAILIHEVNHLLRDHFERREEREKVRWNVAGDCCINQDIGLALPDYAVHPQKYDLPLQKTTEWYYEHLEGKVEEHKVDCGSCSGGGPRKWEKTDGEDKLTPIQAEIVKSAVAEDVRKAGNAPGSLTQWANTFLKPKADWKTILSRKVRSTVQQIAGKTDYTYRKLSRRNIPGVILPGMVGYQVKSSIVVDSSGSMYNDIHRALSEAKAVCQMSGGRTTVRMVDTMVQKKTSKIRELREAKGFGGTDMRVGIEVALKEDNPDVIIVLTDGETPWPDTPPKIPVIVGCTTDISCPAWAQVVRIGDRGE